MGGTLREVSTLKKLLHFGRLKRPAKLVVMGNVMKTSQSY
jgi:hypothetical protein